MYSPDAPYASAEESLVQRYGPIESRYGPVPFGFTSYYEKEMGAGLEKTYLVFTRQIPRDELASIKCAANRQEDTYRVRGKRRINIDPGYLTGEKLVLASTKDFFHRIYLGHGIFGEVTLHFRKGRYRYFSWTYPDYKEPPFLQFLEKARAAHVHARRTPPGVR
jgi:hypothetical protein